MTLSRSLSCPLPCSSKNLTRGFLHFSHEHPLIFISGEAKGKTSDEEISRVCSGCALPIFSGSPLYTCEYCDRFSLHKSCAELPMELEHHHKHPHHTLLALYPKLPDGVYPKTCSSCDNSVEHNFFYWCKQCTFKLDIKCAFSDHPTEINTIQHKSHPQHPLVLLGKPALLSCDACGEEHRGYFYMCNSCIFYIHQDCASFPRTIKNSDHHAHSLALSYTAYVNYSIFVPTCVICRKPCYEKFWMYWCSSCRYVVHIKCAMSKIEPFMSILLPRVRGRKSGYTDAQIADRDDLIRLPPANEFVSVVDHLTASTNYKNVVGFKEIPDAIEVNHLIGHDHSLVFLEDKSSCSNAATIESFLFGPDRNTFSNVPNCHVCFRAVSPPFYCCKICNLFLHEMCSKLPPEVQHPFHPEHPLIPLPRNPNGFVGIFDCYICGIKSNGICYVCRKCGVCLDLKCALLPRNIIHEAHPYHVLALGGEGYSKGSNNCCNVVIRPWYGYTCNTCDFGIHAHCALYPSTVHYKYDEHELKLMYDPSQGNSDEYYCQICEVQIDQRYWFYHCIECDVSFHIWCYPPDDHKSFRITGIPSIGFYPNMNFGITFNFDWHPHILSFVQHLEGLSCNFCGDRINACKSLAFECSKCNFVIHLECCE